MGYTPEQIMTIREENEEILVSASAGCGKTEVLCERIVHMIVRRGFSIERMAVVTFTRAAANEMRERLLQKLTAAAENDERILKECELLPLAQISTIDSLCSKIVRSHFEAARIDPSFGILQGDEREKIWSACLDEAMNELYEKAKDDEDIHRLCEDYTDAEISEMIRKLSPFLSARPDPLGYMREYAEKRYEVQTLDGENFAQEMLNEGLHSLNFAMEQWSETAKRLGTYEIDPRYGENIDSDGAVLISLRESAKGGLSAFLQAVKNASWQKMKTIRKDKEGNGPVGNELYKELREKYKGIVKKLAEDAPVSLENAVGDLNVTQQALRGLTKLTIAVMDKWEIAKEKVHGADFADIQAMALKILQDEQLRADVAGQYDAIFVDEYQDVSLVQEELLRLLKREGGCAFYVGDVKQSIYRFRQAEPSIFLNKLKEFSLDSTAKKRKIYLQDNFRSVTTVQKVANRVFEQILQESVTDIDYDEDARLRREKPSVGDESFEIHVMEKSGEVIVDQATWIAGDILSKVGKPFSGGKELQYGDILVLMPVGKGRIDKVENVFRYLQIPVSVEGGGNAAQSPEIQLMAAYLECLTDESNDEAFLAVLRSPILHFDEGELCELRLCAPEEGVSLRDAMKKAAEGEGMFAEKCRSVLSSLEAERVLCDSLPLEAYLEEFLQRSGFGLYAAMGRNGEQATANLHWMCEAAMAWEETHSGGAAEFARFLKGEKAVNEGASPAARSAMDNSVHIMTIHKAKGLGARLVYLMDASHELKNKVERAPIRFHNRLGIALQYRNVEKRVKRNTLPEDAISVREKHEERAEKARLLYVAMTRAKEQTIVVGCGECPKEIEEWRKKRMGECSLMGVANARSYLDWITLCLRKDDPIMCLESEDAVDAVPSKVAEAYQSNVAEAFQLNAATGEQGNGNTGNDADAANGSQTGLGLNAAEAYQSNVAEAFQSNAATGEQGNGNTGNDADAVNGGQTGLGLNTAEAYQSNTAEAYQSNGAEAFQSNAATGEQGKGNTGNDADAANVGVSGSGAKSSAYRIEGQKTISTFVEKEGTYPHVENSDFHEISTSYPQKTGQFEVYFHKYPISVVELWKKWNPYVDKTVEKTVENMENAKNEESLKASERAEVMEKPLLMGMWTGAEPFDGIREHRRAGVDCLLPQLAELKTVRKVGVTQLLSALRQKEEAPESEETEEIKREPMESLSASSLADSMPIPRFLTGEAEAYGQKGTIAGSMAHLVLELINLKKARHLQGLTEDFVRDEIARMVREHKLLSEEAALVNPERIADFLDGEIGRRMLASPRVERELSFTLHLDEYEGVLLQGMMDLCFLEDGEWVLVDFKTDFVRDAEELRGRYAKQIDIYRKALEQGTGQRVKEAVLYSLRKNQAVRC